MKKMVWARSSRHLFIHPTVIAQICSQFYHGMLLNMKKMQAPSSNSPQPLPQGRIYWTKVGRRLGKRYSLSLRTSHSSKLFPDMGCINTANQSLPTPPFLSKHCLPLSHPISAKTLKTFIQSPGSSCNKDILARKVCKLPILSPCPLFSHPLPGFHFQRF